MDGHEKQLKDLLIVACALLECEAADHRLAPDRTEGSHKRIANTLEAFVRNARLLLNAHQKAA